MATDKEASSPSCASDPNFAVICSFLDKFSNQCGITYPSFAELQDMLEDTQTVSQVLIDLHVKLLRKARKSFTADKWERALAKFCHTYSQQDGWELERFGYKKARLEVKVKLLKVLLETQFDVNTKFKTEVNKLSPTQLRLEPLGRDQTGLTYWCQFDPSSNVRVYREDVDEESWELVAKDRDGLVQLIDSLSNGEGQQELNSILNEDSTSQEVEKPITDTGQNGIEDELGEEEEEEEEDEGEDEDDDQIIENTEETADEEIKKEGIKEENCKTDIKEGAEIDKENSKIDLIEDKNKAETDEERSKVGIYEEIKEDIGEERSKAVIDEENIETDASEDECEEEEASDLHSGERNPTYDKLEKTNSSVLIKTNEKRTNGQINLVIKSSIIPNGVGHSSDTNESCLSTDLCIKGEHRNYPSQIGNFYMVPDRDPLPETADILSQMSMRFNEKREAEDLSNPSKKLRMNLEDSVPAIRHCDKLIDPEDQPMMLVKKAYKPDISDEPISLVSGATLQRVIKEDGNSQPEVSEAIEEPIQYVVGAGSGADCKTGNVRLSSDEVGEKAPNEPQFSEVIEEPVLYFVGQGSGMDCYIGNPKWSQNSIDNITPHDLTDLSLVQNSPHLDPNTPEFSNIIEEPVQYVSGYGTGAECGVGSPLHTRPNIKHTCSQSFATMGIECLLNNLSFTEFEPCFSDVIEEPVMFFKGNGNGYDCLTGNNEEKAEASTEESNPEKKSKLWSINTICPEKDEDLSQTKKNTNKKTSEVNSLKPLSEIKSKEENIPLKDEPLDDSDLKEKSLQTYLPIDKKEECSLLNSSTNEMLKVKPVASSILDIYQANNPIRMNCLSTCVNSDTSSKIISKDCIENCLTNSEKTSNEKLKNDVSNDRIQQTDKGKNDLSKFKNPDSVKSSNGVISENGPFSADKLTSKEESKSGRVDESGNNSSDKKSTERKNVMLTNIIEVCLDNNTNENTALDLKENDNAKYNDLFTAKDLLNPPTIITENSANRKILPVTDEKKLMSSSNTEEEKVMCAIKSECKIDIKKMDVNFKKEIKGESKVDNEVDQKPIMPATIKSEVDIKKEPSNEELKVEKNIEEQKHDSEMDKKNKKKIQNEEGGSEKLGNVNCEDDNPQEEKDDDRQPYKTMINKCTEDSKENYLNAEDKNEEHELEKDDSIPEETKVAVRGRKSRTNSLNDEKETEVPNKKPKTDKLEIKPARRSSRRNNSQNSSHSSELKKTGSKDDKDASSNEAENDAEVKEEKSIDPCDKSENDKMPKNSKNENLSVSKFSMETGINDGTIEKPAPLKNQNRKRRSSMRLSKSEEDAGEPPGEEEAEEEEAGGKKPRLKGKARRTKSKMVASKPPPPVSSSDEEPEETSKPDETTSENIQESSVVKNSKRRPIKPRRAKTSIASTPTKKKSFKSNNKKSDKSEGETDKSNKKKTSPKKAETTKKSKVDMKKKNTDSKKANDSTQNKRKGKLTNDENKSKRAGPKTTLPKLKIANETPTVEAEEETEKDNEEEEKIENDLNKEDNKVDNENCNAEKEEVLTPEKEENKPPVKKIRNAKRKTLLGLTEWDLVHTKKAQEANADGSASNVRQSRRIAQIKIKEEAERRAIEEATMLSLKEVKKKKKDDSKESAKKGKKKKSRGEKSSEEEDATFKEPPKEERRGRKKKKGHDRLKFDENRPWQSSSGSSSEEPDDEEDHFEEEDDEEDIRMKKIVSDHEFSPESDLEKEEEPDSTQPIRRARTAKKVDVEPDVETEEKEVDDQSEDFPCKKCGQPDHPEWILLCDKCDSGYHASCLRPPLMLIPEGDWFCPPCQHADLVFKLKETLRTFEKDAKKRENEELRRKRLAYVGISLANVLPSPDKHYHRGSNRRQIQTSSDEGTESSEEESESSSEEEPVYQLRQRRATVQTNYRFNDYDELINSAIQDEMEAVKGAGNMGRGKDIQNIVDAEKVVTETKDIGENNDEGKLADDEDEEENWRPRVVPKITALPSLRKKAKKLTDLDMPSDDDGSDEDFKGSSVEEEASSTDGGESDDSVAKVPVRRSERARQSRIDREFINDDSDSSDEPRRKKTRRLYASSSSESSGSWGRRKRKSKSYSRIKNFKGKKKSTKYFDSDSDVPKKVKSKRPKIKYGISSDEEPVKARTRGKKVSYLDVQGSDTEEEVIRQSRKLPSEDEEEFVPDKDEEEEEEKINKDCKELMEESDEESDEKSCDNEKDVSKKIDKSASSAGEAVNDLKEPAVIVERIKTIETSRPSITSENEDDEVEEEEIEEEIEEEVEEEEEEEIEEKSESEGKPEEAKDLAIPKLRVVQPNELIRSDLVRKGVTLAVVKDPEATPPQPTSHPQVQSTNSPPAPRTATGPQISSIRQPVAAAVSAIVATPSSAIPAASSPQPKPPTIIKAEAQDLKKEEKEDKKETPVPAIRLVPSAKLIDPNKARRPIEEGVIRGMLGGGGYYRPPHPQQRVNPSVPGGISPAAGYLGRQQQRYPDQRYSMYQPPHQLPPPHQFFPQSGRYYQPAASEDYGSGGFEDPSPPVPSSAQQVIGGSGVTQGTDEDGVFSGLVSYFSSQREDPLDS